MTSFLPAVFLIPAGLGMVLGVVGLFSPKAIWWLREGWRFRDAEPSEAALVVTRIGCLLTIVMTGVLMYFFTSFLPRF